MKKIAAFLLSLLIGLVLAFCEGVYAQALDWAYVYSHATYWDKTDYPNYPEPGEDFCTELRAGGASIKSTATVNVVADGIGEIGLRYTSEETFFSAV